MVNSPNLPRREMSAGALVIPVDMEVYSLSSSPVLSSSPRLGADFLSSSPLFGSDFLSELHRSSRPWHAPRTGLFGRIGCQRRSPAPPSDDEDDDDDEDEEEEEEEEAAAAGRPRSILVVRGADVRATPKDKKVVFADDKGMPLVQVRRMREPSHMPPRWTARFLRHVTGLEAPPPKRQQPSWTLGFPQPAADYTRFCERLDAQGVALEHVLFKELDGTLAGTVKVKNLHFEKQVFVRVTEDGWRTSRDVPAKFVPPSGGGVTLHDRFSFVVDLPERGDRVDFCVCFRCPAGEFWDNNGGHNFSASRQKAAPAPAARAGERDIYHAQVDNWSCFSSWSDEFGGGPYW